MQSFFLKGCALFPAVAFIILLSSCVGKVGLADACSGSSTSTNGVLDCSSLNVIEPTKPVTSFKITGVMTGSGFTGKNIVCSTIEATPVEVSQALDLFGAFALTMNKTGEVPIRCVITDGANNFAADVVFSETISRSLKSNMTLNNLVVVRRADTATVNLGIISLDGQVATTALTGVSQDGDDEFVGRWMDVTGVWNRAANISIAGFSNDMTIAGLFDVTQVRFNQSVAVDDLAKSHTMLSAWAHDAGSTPQDNLAGCSGKEGYALPSGWSASSNPTAFQIYSEPAVNFSTAPNVVATSALADFVYAAPIAQNICGMMLTPGIDDTCDDIVFPASYAGLNQAQCQLLCIMKSMDAVSHFMHPSYASCPFEYKTDLTGDLATTLPASGTCAAANGDPCPGLIMKPELVIGRNYFEEIKVQADTASFYKATNSSVRRCIDANSDGDLLDAGDCAVCSYDDKISVVIRMLSANSAYTSQRITRFPAVTNSATVCAIDNNPAQDSAFAHRAGELDVVNLDNGNLTGNSRSHVYIMTK